ncbi:hypothetical protein GCM10028801_31310 [Nocardioides maradonensis]
MAARHITLTLGLMSLTVNKESAIEKPVQMSNLCTGRPGAHHDPSPLRAPRACDHCGTLTGDEDIVKGIKEGGTYRIIQPDEIQKAKAEYTQAYKGGIKLVAHPADEFLRATSEGGSTYYLTPTSGGDLADQYQLLVALIGKHPELVFAGLHTPVSVTGLYMISVRDGVLVMQERVREQAIKPAPSVGGEVNETMYGLLDAMLGQLTTDYDAEAYEDRYAVALERMIADADKVQVESDTTATGVVVSNDELMKKLAALKAA